MKMRRPPSVILALVLLAIGTADGFSAMMSLSTLGRSVSLSGLTSQPKLALGRTSLRGRAMVGRGAAVQRAAVVCMAKPSYEVSVLVKRASGDKFFLEGSFLMAGREKPRTWTFYRTYADFNKLDRVLRRMAGSDADQMSALPPEPFVMGEGSGAGPFTEYIKMLLDIPDAFELAEIYEFCDCPADVLTAAFPGKIPIDVEVIGGEPRYSGKATAVPVLDPVMLAEQAGRGVKEAKEAWKEANVAKNAGQQAAKFRDEFDQVVGPVVGEVFGEVAKKVDSKKSGSVFGSVLGNLRAGKGLFGEELTQKFANQVTDTVGGFVEDLEEAPEYTKEDKWDVRVEGPGAASPLEVTVRPTQKARLLLKAWLAENGIGEEEKESYKLVRGGNEVDLEGEIGASGMRPGGKLFVEKRAI